ncbi:MAG TPA: PxKF domain-containing protein, partial [Gaiellaceae bacterium]|nr:PxKF domain-containing protein [Gaiellaceae bacterium]
SHAEIMGQLDQYLTTNGTINPTTALVTGYDFLSDGATAISNGLKPKVAAPQQLINEVWTKDNLLAAMFPATNAPTIDSVNAHYDHHRALPADQNAAGTETNLFTTGDLATRSTSGRLVITIGCHSGTPVSDLLYAAGFAADWDQSYSARGAIGYVAQSTFGLGETAGVAYSEKLHALLAERLNGSLTVGQALVFAKQEYSAMPLTGGYDVKVIDGSGLYGLPMYKVGTAAVPPPPTPLPLETDAATGLKAATFNLSPSFSQVNVPRGRYYTNGGNASFQNRRPVEPFTKLDVTQSGFVAHGALLTALTSTDTPNVDAVFSRATEDRAVFSPELVGDATSPTRLQSIATFSTPTGQQQRLVISTGQFLADGVPDPLGVGKQRLFNSLGGIVLYAPDSVKDFRGPTFGPVQAFAATPTTVGFAVDVDDSQGFGSVKRVLVLYKDSTGTWRSVDLSHLATSKRWSGGGPFSGTAAEWFIQAADQNGNVTVISNKANIDPVTLPNPTGGLSAIVSVVSGTVVAGWYKGDARVDINGPSGVQITSSRDGAPFAANSAVTVSGTGLHTVEYQGSNGGHGTTIVPIDTTEPTIAVKAGVAQTEVGQGLGSGLFTCGDAGSGIESCTATGIDTSTPTLNGTTRTFTVTAKDRVGLTATATGTYRVIYAFRGFFQPVDNLPVLNSVNGGSAVPVKFSLGGDQGLNILAVGYPKSGKVTCDAGDPITTLETTLTAGNSSLSYSAGEGKYNYVWKTDKAWGGTCRQLSLLLADGTEHHANFKFK